MDLLLNNSSHTKSKFTLLQKAKLSWATNLFNPSDDQTGLNRLERVLVEAQSSNLNLAISSIPPPTCQVGKSMDGASFRSLNKTNDERFAGALTQENFPLLPFLKDAAILGTARTRPKL